ncbi:sensor domain-containing diguanylate cyclase [Chromohalobacter israelensis]|uniref:sensor domain-containing diguanylate cyclase n=1 Tax=Chromohalobacter israelensis TaxID=141390 RepID=UPI0002E5CB0B|nr:EAL domain-containing protein [Chromohalobacter salexigens]
MSSKGIFTSEEKEKLKGMYESRLSRLGPSHALDCLTQLASSVIGVPTSLVTLLGPDVQWIKSRYNFGLDVTPLESSFCRRTVQRKDLTIIEDALDDDEFKCNDLVNSAPYVRFYAGAPLFDSEGAAIGGVCVIDYEPRKLSDKEAEMLRAFSVIASNLLESSNNVGFVDSVTFLPNQQRLMRDLDALHARQDEDHVLPKTVIVLEVVSTSGYHELAKSYGVEAVEEVSKNIADLLRVCLSERHLLYAVSLSRFSVLVPQSERGAVIDIVAALNFRIGAGGNTALPVNLQVCAGYYDFDPLAIAPRDTFRRALSALYEALAYREPVMAYQVNFDNAQQRKVKLINSLPEALEDRQLYLMVQPKINMRSGEVVGLEALLRWRHPEFGELSPMEFVPLVAQTYMVNDLTHWVVREALGIISRFHEKGCYLTISVNVTTTNLFDDSFFNCVESMLGEFGVDPKYLEIECLETEELLEDYRIASVLQALRDIGVRIALDDFGSGYSNLNYLRRIPVDVVKIDRSIIKDMEVDAGSRAIVFRLVQILKHFDYGIVAEGIENQATADQLLQFGCVVGQGYYFYRPMIWEKALESFAQCLPSS